MKQLIVILVALSLCSSCSDIELTVTCKNSDALDYVAMTNTPYVPYYSTEEQLREYRQQIEKIRAWADKQDRCTRAAYEKWLGVAEYEIREVQANNRRRERQLEGKDAVPVPPVESER